MCTHRVLEWVAPIVKCAARHEEEPRVVRGIGRALLLHALDDLRAKGWRQARLTTQIGSRADRFYRRDGWRDGGVSQSGERIFTRDL